MLGHPCPGKPGVQRPGLGTSLHPTTFPGPWQLAYMRLKTFLFVNSFPLWNAGVFWINYPFLPPPGQRSGSRQVPSFPFPYPLLPADISANPVTSACKVHPQIGPPLPVPPCAPGPAPFAAGPALGPLHWLFLLSECFFSAVTTSLISFAVKNVCHGRELQEGNGCVYLDHRCVSGS